MAEVLTVEIVYGTAERQSLYTLTCAPGTTAESLLDRIDWQAEWPGMVWRDHRIGLYSRFTTPDTPLLADGRLEVYRPLSIDPKQARLNRAKRHPLLKK
jgi:putative ubiquitin-RnfH superfamily antitoxin RatB of RatAB toxin-antitoxin module